ncbi:putative non-specific serine/threonine protein kinase [Helianthus anomalus]
MISTILPQQQPQAATYNYPCGDLLERGRRREYISICVPLYKASIKGDWEAASIILKGRENLVRFSITEIKETPLHLAARARSHVFVRNLLDMMETEDLKLQNEDGNTAFCLAATAGDVRIAKIMVEKNPEVLTIRGTGNMMPLYLAASNNCNEMVKYLYCERTATDGLTDDDWNRVFLKCAECELFGMCFNRMMLHVYCFIIYMFIFLFLSICSSFFTIANQDLVAKLAIIENYGPSVSFKRS